MTEGALKGDRSFAFEIFFSSMIQYILVRAGFYVLLSKKVAHATVFTVGQAMGLIHFMILAVRDPGCPRTGPSTRCGRQRITRWSDGGGLASEATKLVLRAVKPVGSQ